MKVTKVYLCGPMTGVPHHNVHEFMHYEDEIAKVSQFEAVNPHHFFKKGEAPLQSVARKRAIQEMLKCDMVAVLPSWKLWPTSFLHDEMALARRCNIPLVDANTIVSGPQPLMEGVLEEANRLINSNRDLMYGHPKEAFENIASLWMAYIGAITDNWMSIKPSDVANMFILSKMARTMHNPNHRDSWVDIAGYAGAAARALHLDP